MELSKSLDAGKKAKTQQDNKDRRAKKMTAFEEMMDKKLQSLYTDFLAHRKEGHQLSREQKLSLMKDALTVDGDADFATGGALPSFFAKDLIMFGIKKDFPDAVRAGEKLMIEAGEVMPREISMALKQYMLKHSDSYYAAEAMQRSGPLDTAKLYRSTQEEPQPLFCIDDPYWQDVVQKNWRREDQYKIPSVYAWAHKQDGIMGEIFDMDEIRRKDQMFREMGL